MLFSFSCSYLLDCKIQLVPIRFGDCSQSSSDGADAYSR